MQTTFGRNADSIDHWKEEAARYLDQVGESRTPYHAGRLETATRLLGQAGLHARAGIVDFGCGEGIFARQLAAAGYSVLGMDLVEEMVVLARGQDPDGRATYATGGAAQLASAGQCDAIVALNVLAYLTDAELDDYWSALDEILAPGGALLVSHSNALFDLFALNAGTAHFFAEHFTDGAAVDDLLALDGSSTGYNVRANPLTYRDELAAHGFEEVARAFFNFHPLPPALLGEGDAGRVFDPDEIALVPEWKQQFQCSTMFSLARRVA